MGFPNHTTALRFQWIGWKRVIETRNYGISLGFSLRNHRETIDSSNSLGARTYQDLVHMAAWGIQQTPKSSSNKKHYRSKRYQKIIRTTHQNLPDPSWSIGFLLGNPSVERTMAPSLMCDFKNDVLMDSALASTCSEALRSTEIRCRQEGFFKIADLGHSYWLQ